MSTTREEMDLIAWTSIHNRPARAEQPRGLGDGPRDSPNPSNFAELARMLNRGEE